MHQLFKIKKIRHSVYYTSNIHLKLCACVTDLFPIFRAHEHVHNLLEKTFLPLFLQSDDVSNLIIYFV